MARAIRGASMSDGVQETVEELEKLANAGRAITANALYKGAGVFAQDLAAAVATLPTGTPKGNSSTGHPFTGLTPAMRTELAASLGIAKFQDSADGFQTSVGFDGYLSSHTEEGFPDGVPARMIVASLESGSSVRAKNPFVRRTTAASKAKTEAAMVAGGEEKIAQLLAGGGQE